MTRKSQVQLAEEAEATYRKERARLKTEQVKLRRKAVKGRGAALSIHRAAEQNRFTKDWYAPPTSADGEIIGDLQRITARARQGVRDNPYIKSAVRSFKRNWVGTGITPSLGKKPYKKAWERWARDPKACDIEGRRTFVQIQRWAAGEIPTAGEAIVIRWIVGGQLKLQCIESEQMDMYSFTNPDTKNDIIGGVEVDENGKAVAYHIYRRHPYAIRGLRRPAPLSLETVRIPAEMVCHLYDPDRVLQTRGVSWFAPILRKARDLGEFDDAELRVARAQAGIGLLIKGPSMDENGDASDPLELDGLSVGYINEDEDVTPFTPSRPSGTYDPYVKANLRAMAAGVGLSYDQIARDFDTGTFSSKRMAALEDHREAQPIITEVYNPHLNAPVMDDFVHCWAMKNAHASEDYFTNPDSDFAYVDWQGQEWDWVDPEAQGKSVERKMRLRLTSRTIEANRLGRTIDQLDNEIATDGTEQIIADINKGGADGREVPGVESTGIEPTDDQVGEVNRNMEIVDA